MKQKNLASNKRQEILENNLTNVALCLILTKCDIYNKGLNTTGFPTRGCAID